MLSAEASRNESFRRFPDCYPSSFDGIVAQFETRFPDQAKALTESLSLAMAGRIDASRNLLQAQTDALLHPSIARFAARLNLHAGKLGPAYDLLRQAYRSMVTISAMVEADFFAVHAFKTGSVKDRPIIIDHDRPLQRPSVDLAICACLKNEAHDIAEWIVYHAVIGVKRFYLYLNDCDDDTEARIKGLASKYDIVLRFVEGKPAQSAAYQDFLNRFEGDCEWVAFLDGDEYIAPSGNADICESLSLLPESVAAVALNWRIFGSSGRIEIPTDLCIESFLYRSDDASPANDHIKTIVRPAAVIRLLNQHQFLVLGRYVSADGGDVFPMLGKIMPKSHARFYVHHYAVKSAEQWTRKKQRGRPDVTAVRNDDYFLKLDLNDVRDESLLRFARPVRAALGLPDAFMPRPST